MSVPLTIYFLVLSLSGVVGKGFQTTSLRCSHILYRQSSTDSFLFQFLVLKDPSWPFFFLSNGPSFIFNILYSRTTSSLISVTQPHFHWDFPWIFSYENRRAETCVLTSVFSVLNISECALGNGAHRNSLEKFLQFQWLLSGVHVGKVLLS